jgi:hypothetical protein
VSALPAPPPAGPHGAEDKLRVLVAWVHPGTVRTEFMESFIKMLGASKHSISYMACTSGPLVGRARNLCLDHFMKGTWDVLFFIDSDMVFDEDALDKIIALRRPIVAGLMYGLQWNKQEKFIAASVKNSDGDYKAPLEEFKPMAQPLWPVDGVGMAFTAIWRGVVEKMAEENPHKKEDGLFTSSGWPFEMTWEDGRMMGEDIAFCVRAKQLGFQSYIALDVRIGHVKSFVI